MQPTDLPGRRMLQRTVNTTGVAIIERERSLSNTEWSKLGEQVARLDPWRGAPAKQAARPPTGPSAPPKRTSAAAALDEYSGCPPLLKRRRTDGSSATGAAQPPPHPGQQRSRQQRLLQHGQAAFGRGQLGLRLSASAGRAPVHERLHSFFSRRNRELSALGHRRRRFQREATAEPPVGLLALPEDVLVRSSTRRCASLGVLDGLCRCSTVFCMLSVR